MGWRFRKSIKILPGVRLNFNKNSTSVSIGSKRSGITINSKTGVTARTSIPGTGLSYSEKISSPKKSAPAKKTSVSIAERNKQIYTQEAQNDLRIIGESSKIVEETLKPDVFFYRFDLIFDRYEHLSAIEKFVSFQSERPSEIYAKVKDGYDKCVEEFIWKFFLDALKKAMELKTTSGRQNRIRKSFDSIMLYQDKMCADCVELCVKLRDDYLQKV